MDTRGEQVRTIDPEMVPAVAVKVVVPGLIAATTPTLFTVATPGFDESQVTDADRLSWAWFE